VRKYTILVALCAFVLLPSATKAGVDARTALQVAKPPTLKCSIASVRLIGTSVVATGGCKFGTKPAPAKWSWVQRSLDLSGSACQFGTGKGTSKRSNLLAYPLSVPRISSSALPGLLDATFTVTARWGKKVATAKRSLHKRTAESRVLCGAPPKLISLDGPTPSALTWVTPPTFDGTILRAGTIQSRGNGQCKWNPPRYLVQGGYLTSTTSDFSCANGYAGHISVMVYYYTVEVVEKCKVGLQNISSFAIPPSWGPGLVGLQMYVVTFDGDKQFPYNGDNLWQTSSWFEALGNVDPCTTDLGR